MTVAILRRVYGCVCVCVYVYVCECMFVEFVWEIHTHTLGEQIASAQAGRQAGREAGRLRGELAVCL